MTFIRRNVWELGGDWADEVLWYARGVAAMKARALAKPTSWRFYAGMHGFSSARWQELGYLFPIDQPPSQAQLSTFWRQCQHGSWYFLPWHRGYVLALEANIRAEVVALNGPDDWALPYWNYFAPNEAALPPAFASPDWPDGVGDNPLFVEQRYGPNGDGDVFVPTNLVNLNALDDPDFTGVSSGGSPGFGGVDTGFSHDGPVHGRDRDPAARLGARPRGRPGRAATGDDRRHGGPEDRGPRPDLLAAPREHRQAVGELERRPRSSQPDPADVAPGPGQRRRACVLRTDAGRHDVHVHPRRDDEPRGPRL